MDEDDNGKFRLERVNKNVLTIEAPSTTIVALLADQIAVIITWRFAIIKQIDIRYDNSAAKELTWISKYVLSET